MVLESVLPGPRIGIFSVLQRSWEEIDIQIGNRRKNRKYNKHLLSKYIFMVNGDRKTYI